MGFKVITGPVVAALVPIAELMRHLKDEGADSNRQTEMQAFLAAAHGHAQHYCGKSFGAQTLELALDAFPSGGIQLAMPPAVSITSVKYLDEAGAEQTLDAAAYALDNYSEKHWLLPAYEVEWPDTLDSPNVVKVRYIAGSDTLPPAVRNALLLFTAHLDMNREAVAVGNGSAVEMPLGVKALLDTEADWGPR